MFTKAALSRSRFVLVVASAFAVAAACAWHASPADASPVFSGHASNFFDASLAWLRGGRAPALRNGVLDTPADLTVTTDATPFVARDVTWHIAKAADQDRLDVAPSDTATFAYTLSVTHEIGPESEWLVFGTIHVHNPNVFDVSGVDVTNAVDNGGTCTVEGDAVHTVTIPGNNTLDFNYFCTYTVAPSPSSGTSEATVIWPDIGSPSTSAARDAAVDFTDVPPSNANGSVDVVDPQDPDGATVGSVSVDDPNPSTFTYSVPFSGDPAGTCTSHANTASLTIDALVLGSATKTVEVCVGAGLTVTNSATASVSRTFQWGISKSVNEPSQTVAPGDTATFDYTVKVTHDAGTDAWSTTGTIHVSNPNDWEPITADVTDAVDNGGVCTVTGGTNVSVSAGGYVDLPYTCSYASAPSSQVGTNTATVTWDPATSATQDGSATGSAIADFGSVSPAIVDGSVAVADTLGGTLGTVSYTDPSPTPFTYQHGFSGDPAGGCTSHPNTATFTTSTTGATGSASRSVDVCVTSAAADLTVTKTVAHTSFTRTYPWTVTKSVDKPSQNVAAGGPGATFNYTVTATKGAAVDSNWTISGTITVANSNTRDIDAQLSDGSCVLDRTSVTVPAKGSVDVGYSCALTSGAAGTNTATATWNKTLYSTPTGTASGSADYAFTAPTTVVGDSVDVYDNGTKIDATNASMVYHYSRIFLGVGGTCTGYDNTATLKDGATVVASSAKVTVTVCAGVDIAVAKTAATSFTRTYKWAISKSVAAPATVTKPGGSSASFAYTVNVAAAGYVDSAWAVAGKITVTNPNDWENVTLSLADSLPGCTLASTSVTVQAGKSVDVGYTCPLAGGSPGTNTVIATWNTSLFPTPHGSATGGAAFAFGAPTTELGKTVTVTDTFNGATTTLGAGPATFTYSRTVTVPMTGCLTYPNTATIVETGQAATASVQVCGRAPISATGGFPFAGTEPAAVNGTVATFTDPDTSTTASAYIVSIDWGDGSASSSGTVTGGSGSFSVRGSHTYSEEGAYTISVKIAVIGSTSSPATVTDSASVADAALTANCATAASSLQLFNGRVANLVDANPIGTLSDFSATIDWGDGSTSAGTLSGTGPFTVAGTHTYGTTGLFTVTTSIKDVGGSTARTACRLLVFAFAPGGGSFVIGDNNSRNGTPVEFWGAQRWKLNSLTGGDAPAAFKGFALNPPTPSCGNAWSTDPGNSAPPPPGPLPSFMAVIVSSSITKAPGKTIYGDTPHIVVVQTNPGYDANSGHEGTGTVIAQLC
jgi:hypothetical protein